ncbi:metal-dependent hydrolase [Natrinema versiforme]|uniref:Membrane-bound metal-dependent hydrolase n=1 Tax=Natrinema versiforme JCM 10478 TaxID=1227496 RepID=L9Y1K0_9EURY|nr:metal-dependent hydrolase [Natrinema versiforme]ELY67582.1 membrane-bound metal-dependent hydrolase [Natrinema versiforme JCM 10478]
MVATGVHILIGLALAVVVCRSERAEPYLVAALAAAGPDIDTFVFRPLIQLGYVSGPLWSHRGLTHSLVGGVVVIVLLSSVGPWRVAAIGFGSHVGFDMLTGGARLFVPVDPTLYGTSVDWLLLNMLASVVAVTLILGGLLGMKYDLEGPIDMPTPKRTLERFR